ncbi:MAG: hypothetical protein EBU90_11635 [Proteobacteria bacterium]|nr:hypothetical protein [Pseudomonadota bacterium]NBP14777.1 hypothetical protein [bacterium]
MNYESTKILELGSCAFRQWRADSHCKYIHGYRLQAKFWFGCSGLDDKNWVVDFGGLKELKSILEKQFDHTLCIANDDPLLNAFRELHRVGAVDLRIMTGGVGIERTAEWCFKIADEHVRNITNNRCWVNKVEVWEHEKNSAIVTKEQILEGFTETPALEGNKNTPVATTVAAPSPEIQASAGGQIENVPLHANPRPAPVGNKVTSGFSNLFAGTSWGS